MVKVQEAEAGIVTDIGVVTQTDHALLVPAVEHHKKVSCQGNCCRGRGC